MGVKETVPVEKFAAEVDAYRRHGYIFQELLRPHPDLTTICGDRLSTARVVVLVHEDGPRILHAVWKIPVGQNPADNFWRTGNMLGLVDATSGRVTRVVQGSGPDRTEVEVHPDTGQPGAGHELRRGDGAPGSRPDRQYPRHHCATMAGPDPRCVAREID